ncbi:hypothetical protein [Cellulosilyticum sp. I15G10I2]|uniref:hypothetical protein n=1 Tax=Cellulosilyticum sp. I15G10I2 TaxID=1892843 RepID=UPI00085BF38C|nr:hypothetical protein [Cellulosilyticum sp. I15G10I2]
MDLLESINDYIKHVKNNPYVYSIQKSGIEVFVNYIKSNHSTEGLLDIQDIKVDKLLLYWIPKNKKYLSEVQAYQIVYTVHDIYQYLIKRSDKDKDNDKDISTPTILDLYGEEYMRVYRVRNMLQRVTKDPILATDPLVVDLNYYKNKKKKNDSVEMVTTYEQAVFKVQECKEGGQVILTKLCQEKIYKLLLEYPTYKYFKKGDLIHAIIKRKLFYVYWEIEEIKSYYLPEAEVYL